MKILVSAYSVMEKTEMKVKLQNLTSNTVNNIIITGKNNRFH